MCEYTFSLFLSASQAFFQLYKFHSSMARMPNLSAKKMQGRSIFVIGRKKERHASKTPLLCDCVDIKGRPSNIATCFLFFPQPRYPTEDESSCYRSVDPFCGSEECCIYFQHCSACDKIPALSSPTRSTIPRPSKCKIVFSLPFR